MAGSETSVRTEDGAELFVRVLGEGTDVLVVPGAAFDADLERLAQGRRVVFYDARSRGRSSPVREPTRLGFFREVEDLESVRAALGIERMALLGWSYNAGVTACYALARPVRVARLVLVAPIAPMATAELEPGPEPEPHLLARLDQLRAEGLPERDPVAYCREWRRVYVPLLLGDPACFEAFRSDPCAHPNEWPDRVTRSLAHVFIDLGVYDWRDALRGLEVPSLVVHGERDQIPLRTAGEWADVLPECRAVTLPGVGHFPWVEAPERFFAEVGAFLAGGP